MWSVAVQESSHQAAVHSDDEVGGAQNLDLARLVSRVVQRIECPDDMTSIDRSGLSKVISFQTTP